MYIGLPQEEMFLVSGRNYAFGFIIKKHESFFNYDNEYYEWIRGNIMKYINVAT